jgi:hypothetical protein
MRTQRRRPKIDVGFESCVLMKAALYTVMMMMMMMMMMISYDVFCVCLFFMSFGKWVALDFV